MLLIIFVLSVLALEGILLYDKVTARNSKTAKIPPVPVGPLPDDPLPAASLDSVFALAQAVEGHGRGAQPETSDEPVSVATRT
jgi:hypothetical protein